MDKKKLFLTAFTAFATSFAWANTQVPPTPPNPPQPAASPNADNSMMNRRDATGQTLTPMDQAAGTKNDVELTRRIRQLVVSDGTLSIQAKNSKIITLNGVTTLRGPVKSIEESRKLESMAGQIVGASSVRNELQVTTH